ncbi:MAG: capsular polysaccharide synthesis protein [Acinetobacter sp.]|nr:capsular polysaccharide synthesis protein [Acinetobacter sp.]
MYQRDKQASNQAFWKKFNAGYFDWHQHHYVNVLNSFIVAKKGNPLIHVCTDLILNFWQTQNTIPHYFFFQILFDILVKKHYPQLNCIIIDDTLPHMLQVKLNEPFDPNEYATILSKTNVHKMTYLQKWEKGSFAEYIANDNSHA